ncbi:AI-2E family transporter [Lysinibacillus sphaericus]|uniref:AI-2E family transporter n=1 Tax=Lysinibacillus sphaericus TaxID=1421 RepID=A0A544UJT4_LYSSH|nr:AI-2E family transporter [Lysinibacillus sp. SDF0037]TQR33528.1 AI-2E family transporter [Lysinibacillus sp. SDF0037]
MRNIKYFSYEKTTSILFFIFYLVILWFVLPVSLAIFLSFSTYPIIKFLHSYCRITYWLAAIIVEALILACVFLLVIISINSIILVFPEIRNTLQNFPLFTEYESMFIQVLKEKSLSIFDSIFLYIANIFQLFMKHVIEVFIFLVAYYFALLETRKSRYWFFQYVPKKFRNEWQKHFSKIMQLFHYFLYVEFQLFTITLLILCAGFMILQFEQAIIKAFIVAFADVLPFFGIGVFLVPMSVYFYLKGNTFLCGAILLLYLFVQLTRQLAESMLWSNTLQLRTFHTFFISAASILLFGFYGILLSPIFLFLAVKLKDNAIFER